MEKEILYISLSALLTIIGRADDADARETMQEEFKDPALKGEPDETVERNGDVYFAQALVEEYSSEAEGDLATETYNRRSEIDKAFAPLPAVEEQSSGRGRGGRGRSAAAETEEKAPETSGRGRGGRGSRVAAALEGLPEKDEKEEKASGRGGRGRSAAAETEEKAPEASGRGRGGRGGKSAEAEAEPTTPSQERLQTLREQTNGEEQTETVFLGVLRARKIGLMAELAAINSVIGE